MLSQRMTFTNPLAFVRPPLVFWGGVGVLGGGPRGGSSHLLFSGAWQQKPEEGFWKSHIGHVTVE